MQWQIMINGKSRTVSLPDSIPDNVPFDAALDGGPVKMRWQRATKSLYILQSGSKSTWSCINIRSMSVNKFPGESEMNVASEFAPSGATSAVSLDAAVSLFIPGQEARAASASKKPKVIRSQITGKIIKVLVKSGDSVAAGDPLMIIEAMKMENRVMANASSIVDQVKVAEGDMVSAGAELIRFKQS